MKTLWCASCKGYTEYKIDRAREGGGIAYCNKCSDQMWSASTSKLTILISKIFFPLLLICIIAIPIFIDRACTSSRTNPLPERDTNIIDVLHVPWQLASHLAPWCAQEPQHRDGLMASAPLARPVQGRPYQRPEALWPSPPTSQRLLFSLSPQFIVYCIIIILSDHRPSGTFV